MDDIYTSIFANTWEPVINFGDILKFPLIILLIGSLIYAFLLLLRVRILIDTVDSEGNSKMRLLVYINLIVNILVAIFGTIIILLG